MTLDTFFEKFELLADAPDAVGRMRELVLNLAVQGKLVCQEPSDEPASELLARLARDRPSERRRRPDNVPGRVSRSSVPYQVPDGWAWVSFQDVAIIASNLVNPKNHQDCIHLAPDNIEKGTGILLPCATVREDGVKSSNHRFFAGQIVYSKIRPNLAKVVVVDFDGLCSADMYPIDPLIDPFFLQRYMLSGPFLAQAVKTDTRVAMPKINQTELNAIAVPVPPLAEQKRIVAKVEELMALCDRLEAQQQDRATRHAALARASLARFAEAPTPAHLNLLFHPSYDIPPADLRKAILTLAVQGKLVEQDVKDAPLEVSLPKLAAVASRGQDSKYPSTWRCVPLGSAGEWRGGGTPSKSHPEFWKGEMPWVSPKDMKTLRLRDAQDHISEAAVEGSAVRLIPNGSILMVVRGMILARAFPVAVAERDVTINQDMKALVPLEGESKEFLLLALRAIEPDILSVVERSSHGTCKLLTDVLQAFVIPIPPLAEQRRIIAKVEQLMTLVDRLEARLAASRESAGKLLQAAVIELTC